MWIQFLLNGGVCSSDASSHTPLYGYKNIPFLTHALSFLYRDRGTQSIAPEVGAAQSIIKVDMPTTRQWWCSLSNHNSGATHTWSFLHVQLNLRESNNSNSITTYLFIKCPHLNSLNSENRSLKNFIEIYVYMWRCDYMYGCIRIEIRI